MTTVPPTRVMTPLTGAQHEISAGDYQAVVTELGAGLRELHYQGRPVIICYRPDELPPAGAGQLLAPWPNRVDAGRYSIGDATYQLDLSEPKLNTAIHGLTRWRPWAATSSEPAGVALRVALLGCAGYPFCLEIEAEYQVSDQGLRVSVSARNSGSRPAPYGTGSHPYLTAGTALVDECELTLPAGRRLPVDERGIPSGPPEDVTGTTFDFRSTRAIAQTRLDHAFTELERDAQGLAWTRLAAGGTEVGLWAGPGYRWLQVFTGDALGESARRRALAVEPMTCPPNAFVSGTDLIMLEPGDAVTHSWGIRVTRRPAAG
jgi:aldose 1-epimerase